MWSHLLRRAAAGLAAILTLQVSDQSATRAGTTVRVGQSGARRISPAARAKRCRTSCRAVIPRDDVLRRAEGTFIEDTMTAGDSLLTRWSNRVDDPVRVLITGGDSVPGWQPAFAPVVRRAFLEWARGDVPVRFTFVEDETRAEVRVRWVERLPEQRAGLIRWTSDGRGWLRSADITLATAASDGRPVSQEDVRSIALHEVGHLLGLGHSSDTADVMSAWVSARELTERDRATARLLYALPAGRVD